MAIEWTEVESSNIAAIGVSKDGIGELHIRFASGAEYVYQDVPARVVEDFLDADSKGKFFAQSIKNVYQTEKVS